MTVYLVDISLCWLLLRRRECRYQAVGVWLTNTTSSPQSAAVTKTNSDDLKLNSEPDLDCGSQSRAAYDKIIES